MRLHIGIVVPLAKCQCQNVKMLTGKVLQCRCFLSIFMYYLLSGFSVLLCYHLLQSLKQSSDMRMVINQIITQSVGLMVMLDITRVKTLSQRNINVCKKCCATPLHHMHFILIQNCFFHVRLTNTVV